MFLFRAIAHVVPRHSFVVVYDVVGLAGYLLLLYLFMVC